jgi:hypothetical protein
VCAAAVAVATDDDLSAATIVVHRSGMLIRGVLRSSSRVESCWIPIRRKAILRRQEEVVVMPVVGLEEDALFIMPIAQKYLCRNRSIVEAERDNDDAVDDDEDRVEEEVVDPVDEDRVNFNGARLGLLPPPLTLLLRLSPCVENCLFKR